MRICLTTLLLAGSLQAQTTVLHYSNEVATLTNTKGRVFENIQLIKIQPDGVYWGRDQTMVGRIKLDELSIDNLSQLKVPTNWYPQKPVPLVNAHAKTSTNDAVQEFKAKYPNLDITAKEAVEWKRFNEENKYAKKVVTPGIGADSLIERGRIAFEGHKWTEAAEAWHRLLRDYPNDKRSQLMGKITPERPITEDSAKVFFCMSVVGECLAHEATLKDTLLALMILSPIDKPFNDLDVTTKKSVTIILGDLKQAYRDGRMTREDQDNVVKLFGPEIFR